MKRALELALRALHLDRVALDGRRSRPSGLATGCFPIRDILCLLTRPGRAARRRCAPAAPDGRTSRPCDVLRIAMPSPLRTRGISVTPTYLRSPGVETRCSSRITGWPPCAYLSTHAQQLPPVLRLERLVVLNEVVLLQDLRDLDLHLRDRHVHAAVLRPAGVADAREHIGDRIGHAHVIRFPRSIVSNRSAQFACDWHGTRRNEWLPARLAHAGDVSRQRQLAEADSADAELSAGTRATVRTGRSDCAAARRTSASACSSPPWPYAPLLISL